MKIQDKLIKYSFDSNVHADLIFFYYDEDNVFYANKKSFHKNEKYINDSKFGHTVMFDSLKDSITNKKRISHLKIYIE